MLELGLDVEEPLLAGVEKDGVSGWWLLRGQGEGQGCERREGGWERYFLTELGGFSASSELVAQNGM